MSDKNEIFRCLADQLRQLEAAQGELETFKGKVTKATADEESVLANNELPEPEAMKRLGEAQKLQAIYSARIAHRERLLVTLTGELEETLALAERHFSGLLNDEFTTSFEEATYILPDGRLVKPKSKPDQPSAAG